MITGSQLDPLQEPPDTNVKEGITWDDYSKFLGCGRPGAIACNSQYVKEPAHAGTDMPSRGADTTGQS